MAEERETTDQTAVNRVDGDIRYGAYITAAGLAAIGVSEDGELVPGATPLNLPEIVDVEKAPTKIAIVLKMLGQPDGVLLPDLIEATGWLPHTIRAAITGLRKKNHSVQRLKRDGVTAYRIHARVHHHDDRGPEALDDAVAVQAGLAAPLRCHDSKLRRFE